MSPIPVAVSSVSFSKESVPEARAKATAVAMTTRCKQQVGSRMAAGEDATSIVLRRRRAACLSNTTSIRSKQPCSSHVGYTGIARLAN